MSEENRLKVLKRTTKKISFLKRVTHIKAELNGKIIKENIEIEHYAKPIDALVDTLDYLLISRITVKVGDTVVMRWKLPFSSGVKVTAISLEEAIGREVGRLRKNE